MIAIVTISIPVGLDDEWYASHSEEERRRAALENLLDHPAITQKGASLADLEQYVNCFVWEKEPDNTEAESTE